jgi:GTP-binding protein
LIKAALIKHEPPLYQLKRPKIYYATQIGVAPPTIVAVCNNPHAFSAPYQRYLLGVLRDHLPFSEVPIKLYLQPRTRDDQRDDLKLDEGAVLPVAEAEELAAIDLEYGAEPITELDDTDIDSDIDHEENDPAAIEGLELVDEGEEEPTVKPDD